MSQRVALLATRVLAGQVGRLGTPLLPAAAGGFGAKEMQGPSRMDLPAFYPDLILWQNYGGYLDMDQTLRWWRTHTTAEIGMQTWHPGGNDKVLKPDDGNERMSYLYIPDLA